MRKQRDDLSPIKITVFATLLRHSCKTSETNSPAEWFNKDIGSARINVANQLKISDREVLDAKRGTSLVDKEKKERLSENETGPAGKPLECAQRKETKVRRISSIGEEEEGGGKKKQFKSNNNRREAPCDV
jgi:hypothetical protein